MPALELWSWEVRVEISVSRDVAGACTREFEFFAKWTRTQRIRTVARMPFEAPLLATPPPPIYQRIAQKALHLRDLGITDAAIARRLDVTDKTVAKAIRWLRELAAKAESSKAGS